MEKPIKINGPYLAKTGKIAGRKWVIEYYADGSNRKVLYSRHLMEQKIGRRLSPSEHVDHVNRDKTDDRIENLKIRDSKGHAELDARRVKLIEITCTLCGNTALKVARQVNHNSRQGKAGPFCGRSCAGKYKRALQLGTMGRLPVQDGVPIEEREYFYNDKD